MTMILVGDRSVALAKLRKLSSVRFIHPDESTHEDDGRTNEQNDFLWLGRNRTHIVWIDPPVAWDPKKLKPHPGRHVVFTSTDKKVHLPAAWKKWAKANGIEVQSADIPSNAARIAFLLKGKAGIKFSKDAAEILTTGHPGSLDALYLPIQYLKLQGLETVTAEDAASVCWRGEELKLALAITKALGTKKAMELAVRAPMKKAFGALKYLEKACQGRPDQVECIDLLLSGILAGQWTAYLALQAFTQFCYQLKRHPCPSNSKTGTSSSMTMPQLFLLSGIPYPWSSETRVLKKSS